MVHLSSDHASSRFAAWPAWLPSRDSPEKHANPKPPTNNSSNSNIGKNKHESYKDTYKFVLARAVEE